MDTMTTQQPQPKPSKSRRPRGGGRVFQRGDVFWISFYDHGREHRESAGLTATRGDAEDLLRARLAELHLGQFSAAGRHATVADVLDAYDRHLQLAERKVSAMAPQLKHLRVRFGALRARKITLPLLERYALDQRQRGLAPATIKCRLAYLRSAFNVARRGGLIACRPDWPVIQVRNARQGFFRPSELVRIVAALPKPLDDVVTCAALTGWRRQEVLGLRWADVDRQAGELRIPGDRVKNRAPLTAPIVGALAALLDRRWAARVVGGSRLSEWVFHRHGQRLRDFRHAWANACAEAGVGPKYFHDLRRTVVRDLDRAGVSRVVAMRFTGHRSERTHDRYNVATSQEQASALAALVAYREAATDTQADTAQANRA